METMNKVAYFATPGEQGWDVYRVGGNGIIANFPTLTAAKQAAEKLGVQFKVLFHGVTDY